MEAGYYLNQQGNLAIVYPDQTTEVWVDETNKVYFNVNRWMTFTMTRMFANCFEWEFLGEL
jgi:hypothetical protein